MAWFITTDGMYSAVAHKTDPSLLTVRGRHLVDMEHLQSFLEANHLATTGETKAYPIVAYRSADYPWRIFVTKRSYAAFVAHQVMQIDYGNFKDEVTRKQGRARHDVYSAVWGDLLRIEREPGALRGHAKAADASAAAGVRKPGYASLYDWPPPASTTRRLSVTDGVPRDTLGRRKPTRRQCEDCGRMLGRWNAALCDRCEDALANLIPDDLEPASDEAAAVEQIAAEQLHEPGSPFFIGEHTPGDGCELDEASR